MVQLGFDAQQYEKPTFGDPIPPNWYRLTIASITLESTKHGDGSYLEFTYEVDTNQHPDYGGRKLWDRLNVHNKNEKTQKIARGQMRSIQECCGKPVIGDTDELIGCSVLAKVVVIAASKGANGEDYPAKNEIKSYKPVGAEIPATPASPNMPTVGAASAPAPIVAVAATATATAVPSWMRKP